MLDYSFEASARELIRLIPKPYAPKVHGLGVYRRLQDGLD